MKDYTKGLVAVVLVYVALVSLIAFAVAYTGSAWCLLGLLLTPNMKVKGEDNDKS